MIGQFNDIDRLKIALSELMDKPVVNITVVPCVQLAISEQVSTDYYMNFPANDKVKTNVLYYGTLNGSIDLVGDGVSDITISAGISGVGDWLKSTLANYDYSTGLDFIPIYYDNVWFNQIQINHQSTSAHNSRMLFSGYKITIKE